MKKVYSKRKLYLDRHSKRVLIQITKINHLKCRSVELKQKRRNAIKNKSEVCIFAPEIFALKYRRNEKVNGETRNIMLNFISQINEHLLNGKKVNISFKNTKEISPDGMLLFISEIERLIIANPTKVVMDYPKDDVVEQLFQHLGLFKKVGLVHRKQITDASVAPWNYAYGDTVDTTQFIKLFEKYSGRLSDEVSGGLFESMSEAVTNSIQHSCGHNQPCSCKKNWWMFARHDDNALEVAIYDAGIGIPKSLRIKPSLKEWFMKPVNFSTAKSDTSLIKIAVQSHRSSTRLPHRGKGLRDMLTFVKGGNIGGFSILSGHGSLIYSATQKRQHTTDYKTYLKGTLLQWKIPLDG